MRRRQTILLVFVIWLPIYLLDSIYVFNRGAFFLFKENTQLNTLLTHSVIALFTLFFFFFITHLLTAKRNTGYNATADVGAKAKVMAVPCE